MFNPIEAKRRFVKSQIQKSFDSGINVSEEIDLEKAHNVGDMLDYRGKTYVWTEYAPGKFDWRVSGGRAHKKAGKSKAAANKIDDTTIDQAEYDSQLKIAKQVDDSSRSMAKNIIQGNIDKTKKKLQETISSRPGAKATIAALQKDLTKFVSQKKAVEDAVERYLGLKSKNPRDKIAGFKKYYDEDSKETWYEGQVSGKRVRILQELVGKTDWWNVEIDGNFIKNSDGRAMTFQTPGDAVDEIKETVGNNAKKYYAANKTQSPQDKVKDIMQQFDDTTMDEDEFDEYVDSVLGNDMGQKLRKEILNGNKSFSDKKQAYKDAVERHLGLKTKDSRDKIAQDAGFKDYSEMSGYQDYVTQKNLLKKRSTKSGMRLLYQQEVAKYEKEHADLIKRISNK